MSERLHSTHEKSTELSKEAAERTEELRRKEAAVEQEAKNETNEKQARLEALELAEVAEAKTIEEKVNIVENDHPEKQRTDSFDMTMAQVRSELSPGARVFSSFIHNPTVEKASDFVGKTIARPDSIVSGGLFAFLVVVALYGIAQFNGFALSGFETIGAFVIGWILGLIYDGLKRLLRK